MPLAPKRRKRPWRNYSNTGPQQGRRADASFYHTTIWRKTSKAYRQEHPLCEECAKKGKYVPCDVTDHITPISQGGDPFDWENLQALCQKCHNRKSGKERHANNS